MNLGIPGRLGQPRDLYQVAARQVCLAIFFELSVVYLFEAIYNMKRKLRYGGRMLVITWLDRTRLIKKSSMKPPKTPSLAPFENHI